MKTPPLKANATAGIRTRPATGQLLKSLGLWGELPVDWRAKASNKLNDLTRTRRPLALYLDNCVRCGACADKCPVFLGTGDPNNMPVARAELLRKVYRRLCTATGKLAGRLASAEDLSDSLLEQWFTYFYQCSECRRCAVFCPFGIDTAEITMAAREIMSSIGLVPKYVAEVVKKAHEIGNNLGIPEAAWRDSCEFLEDELKEQTGVTIRIPVNQAGVDVLFVPPSADLFTNTDTMMGCAKFFHAAGIRWTTSTYASEAGNFGLFLNYDHLQSLNRRLIDAALQLNVKHIVMGECGHAWRVAGAFTADLNGPLDFLQPPRIEHICQIAARFIREGKLRLNPSANDGKSVTYHDPCNLARAGQLTEEPREILRAVVNDFREMPANTTREKTFCCGAGGGLLADELMDVRMKAAKPRIESFTTTGARLLATPCAICKAQLPAAFQHHGVEAEVVGVMDLLGNALVI